MREFARPRWILMTLFIGLFAAVSVRLGFWQLSRLDEVRTENAITASRIDREPLALEIILAELDRSDPSADPADLEFTPLTAIGSFDDTGAVRVRSQVVLSQAGTDAVHALDIGDGIGVLVNLGWLPLDYSSFSAEETFEGPRAITGLLRATQLRPAAGREEPEGRLETVARIDIKRLQEQFELTLLPFWIQMSEPATSSGLPIPLEVPDLGEGSHFSYAVQWFSFALTAVVFYGVLFRKELIRSRRQAAVDSPDP